MNMVLEVNLIYIIIGINMFDFAEWTKLSTQYFQALGIKVKDLIRTDSEKGIMQDGATNLPYSGTKLRIYDNQSYAEVKSKGLLPKYHPDKFKGGQKSTNGSYVDMTASGDLFDDMSVTSKDNGFEIVPANKDAKKVVYNAQRGRVIMSIREENLQEVVEDISDSILEQIQNGLESIKEIRIKV